MKPTVLLLALALAAPAWPQAPEQKPAPTPVSNEAAKPAAKPAAKTAGRAFFLFDERFGALELLVCHRAFDHNWSRMRRRCAHRKSQMRSKDEACEITASL